MRPFAVLNAIIFGSAAAITFGLGGVIVIFQSWRTGIRNCSANLQRCCREQGCSRCSRWRLARACSRRSSVAPGGTPRKGWCGYVWEH